MSKRINRLRPYILTIALLFSIAIVLPAQESAIDRLIKGELKMTFPSIYFKHNSTEYAAMPYTADSCFKYISVHFEDNINSLVIWRDIAETEELTNKRIKKLNQGLNKYIQSGKFEIQSMQDEQKISRRTIGMATNKRQTDYLMSLNSSFDFSRSRFAAKKRRTFKNHIERPRLSCIDCWKSGFHIRERRKMHKMTKDKKENHAI